MRKIFDCVETTLDIEGQILTVRVWVGEEQEVAEHYWEYNNTELIKLIELNIDSMLPIDLAVLIANQPKVNAVQVKDKTKDYHAGIMLYTVPF